MTSDGRIGLGFGKGMVSAHTRHANGRTVYVPAHRRVDHGTQPRASLKPNPRMARTPEELRRKHGPEAERFTVRDREDAPLLAVRYGGGKKHGFAVHDETGKHVGTLNVQAGDDGARVTGGWTHDTHAGRGVHEGLLRKLVSAHGSVTSGTTVHHDLHRALNNVGSDGDHELSTEKADNGGVRYRLQRKEHPSLFKGLRLRFLCKSQVKGHWRVNAAGRMEYVKPYTDKRTKRQQAASGPQGSLFDTPAASASPKPQPQGSLFDAGAGAQGSAAAAAPGLGSIPKGAVKDARLAALLTLVATGVSEGQPGAAGHALHDAMERLRDIHEQMTYPDYKRVHGWLEDADDHLARMHEGRQAAEQPARDAEPTASAATPPPKPPPATGTATLLDAGSAAPAKRTRRGTKRGPQKQYRDAGEKIGGARKDVVAAREAFDARPSVANLDALEGVDPDQAHKACKKQAVWPAPGVAEAQKAGRDPGWYLLARTTWDVLATAPKANNGEERKRWMAATEFMRDTVEGAENGKVLYDRLRELEKDSYAWNPTTYQEAVQGHVDALPRLKDYLRGRAKVRGRAFYDHLGQGEYWHRTSQVSEAQKAGKDPSDYLAKQEQAWGQLASWFGEKARKVTQTEDDVVEKWKPSRPAAYERLGDVEPVAVRNAETMLKLFGLRGVEFGNWMDDEASRVHVNRCAEAFVDLAEGLGLDTKDVSLNGRLALAFGARGTGRALAHYEPGKKVINLTKLGGAGTLAHEWWHALENIIGMVEPGVSGMDHPSDLDAGKLIRSESPVLKALGGVLSEITGGEGRKSLKLAPEKQRFTSWRQIDTFITGAGGDGQKALDAVLDRYPGTASRPKRLGDVANYIAAKTGATDLTIQTLNSNYYLDAKSRGDYWGRPHEMLARAFECYMVDALKRDGRGNNYLAFDANYHDRNLARAPYPQGDERDRIGKAFDKLFGAIRATGTMQKALAATGT